MSEIISLAEYNYFYNERMTLEQMEQGKYATLYACLQDDEPNIRRRIETFGIDYVHKNRRVYGKALCRIMEIRIPALCYRDILPTDIHLDLESENAARLDCVAVIDNNHEVSVKSSWGLYRSFQNVLAQHTSVNEPHDPYLDCWMSTGFLIAEDTKPSSLLQSMMVSGKEEGDGSAGAMVPARPKNPSPLRAAEIENPTLFNPLR